MRLNEIDSYFRKNLKIDELSAIDISMNGIQVGAADSADFDVKKIAFAVDACMESFERAAEAGADLIFVHHGLYWGKPVPVTGFHYRRLRYLIENNIALYAAHLPLDMHPEFGNNAGICSSLGVRNPEPFGEYHGIKIGFKGELESPKGLDEILEDLGLSRDRALSVLPFGPDKIKRVAVVSGGAADDVYQAMDEEADLYITGDSSHQIYHPCLERGINLICGGHYHTETWGVRLLSERAASDLGIQTVFLDVPTGL
ncbi:MAG: Nif3-like dinuclear metal center hexameric protein [Spirochaetales bacterium]|nr:Nif3-like dinuclear metal center hexameric protein [Spirochaetales bacterium]